MRHAIAHALNGIVPAWHRLAEAERGRFVPWLAVAMAGGAAWFFAGTTDPDPRRLAGMVLSGLVLVSLGRRWPPVMAIGMLAARAQSLTVTLTPLQMVEVLGLQWFGDTGMERVDNALASLVSLGVVEILARESHAVYERRDRITVMVRE